jgi:hypothetical protein
MMIIQVIIIQIMIIIVKGRTAAHSFKHSSEANQQNEIWQPGKKCI